MWPSLLARFWANLPQKIWSDGFLLFRLRWTKMIFKTVVIYLKKIYSWYFLFTPWYLIPSNFNFSCSSYDTTPTQAMWCIIKWLKRVTLPDTVCCHITKEFLGYHKNWSYHMKFILYSIVAYLFHSFSIKGSFHEKLTSFGSWFIYRVSS